MTEKPFGKNEASVSKRCIRFDLIYRQDDDSNHILGLAESELPIHRFESQQSSPATL
jgi:hypothetical protein